MHKYFLPILVLTMSTAIAGTNKTTGEVCQGSDCGGAGGYTVNVYKNQPVAVVRNDPSISAGASAGSVAGATATSQSTAAGGAGGAGGSASSTVNVYPETARTPIGKTTVRYEGGYTVKGYSPDVSPSNNTANCVKSAAFTTWWVGFSLPLTDEGCDTWRDYDMLQKAGYGSVADQRLCGKAELAKLLPFCQQQTQAGSTGGYQH